MIINFLRFTESKFRTGLLYNKNMYFYIETLYELNYTLHRCTNYHYPRLWANNLSVATTTAHYPWDMGLLLGDVHLSELKRWDKPCAMYDYQILSQRHYPLSHLITNLIKASILSLIIMIIHKLFLQ